MLWNMQDLAYGVDMLISIDFRYFFLNRKNGLNTFDMVDVLGKFLRNNICAEII